MGLDFGCRYLGPDCERTGAGALRNEYEYLRNECRRRDLEKKFHMHAILYHTNATNNYSCNMAVAAPSVTVGGRFYVFNKRKRRHRLYDYFNSLFSSIFDPDLDHSPCTSPPPIWIYRKKKGESIRV